MAENGGITDDRYITNPLDMEANSKKTPQPSDILTNLSNTWNENKGFYFFLTHHYNLGFERDKDMEAKKTNLLIYTYITIFNRTR